MLQDVTLVNIAQGAAQHLWDREKKRVLENIADPYAAADAVREINLKVKIKPNKERDFATVEVLVSSKLSATQGSSAPVHMGLEEDENGVPRMVMRQEDIAQRTFGFIPGKEEQE